MKTPLILRALSGDAPLLRLFRQAAFHGRVHSVFERAINIEHAAAGLVTVASRTVDNAPGTLIVDAVSLGAAGVQAGDQAVGGEGGLALGGRIGIRLEGATEWEPALLTYPQDDARLRDNLEIVRASVERAQAGWSPACGADMLHRHASALCDALRRGHPVDACAWARALLGLGPGLTPSGDDFLVGLFAVLHVAESPCGRLKGICAGILADADQRTNAISAAALAAAARGRVRESVHEFLRQLMTGSREAAMAALAPVLAIGSTSGADMAAGIVSGLAVNVSVSGASA